MLATSLPVAQWLERPTGVRKVIGLIPVGVSDLIYTKLLLLSYSLKLACLTLLSG